MAISNRVKNLIMCHFNFFTHAYYQKKFVKKLVHRNNFENATSKMIELHFYMIRYKCTWITWVFKTLLWSSKKLDWFSLFSRSFFIYRTRAIITRGLYIFYPIFYCGLYCWAVIVLQTIYVLKKGKSSVFWPKIRSL